MELHLEHFVEHPSSYIYLFKQSVERIEIEISAYCNRSCSFCPNSIVDRRADRRYMSDDLFTSIMRQLSIISYDRELHFHRYNEPMANKPYLLARLKEARQTLPKANIEIYTNGDYLKKEYIQEMAALGCNGIVASLYSDFETFDNDEITGHLAKKLVDLGVSLTEAKYGLELVTVFGVIEADKRTMTIRYSARNMYRKKDSGAVCAENRAESLDFNKGQVRTSPCMAPFNEMQIETDGTLFPCCNMRSDIPEHQQYIICKVEPDSDIFAAWCSQHYVQWRKSLISIGAKEPPCKTCTYQEQLDSGFLRAIDEWTKGPAAKALA
jgi:radical SAM protein with 4Fe4S-binding SPASM domain